MAAPAIPSWQGQLLGMLGFQNTPQNQLFLTDWNRAEGGGAANNPFNTTQPGFNSTGKYNSVGVQNYGDPMSGLRATAATLKNGRYGNILAALQQGNNAKAAAQALANSPWGTGSLVLKMLGGSPSSANPMVTQVAKVAAQSPQQPAQGQRAALLSYLSSTLGNYAKTGQASADSGALAQLLAGQQGITPASPTMAKIAPAPMRPGKITTIPGTTFQADSAIIPNVQSIMRQFGVRVNSAYRSPEHNAAVGGAQNSDHLNGNAIDFVGTPQQMRSLYQWAQGKFPYVEPWDQAGGNHVHISFIR